MKTEKISEYPDETPKYEPGVIVCSCHDANHSIIYQKWEDSRQILPKEVYLSFCMDPNRSFWKRVINSFRYIFRKERFGTHGEMIIDKTNISGLEDIVNFIKE